MERSCGPHDPTDRFTYWLWQVRTNDTLLLPDGGQRRVSATFVDDLARVIRRAALGEGPAGGTFTVTTFPSTSISEIVDAACEVLQVAPRRVSAPPDFLHGHGVRPWVDLPLWLDDDAHTYSCQRLVDAFALRPTGLVESVRATVTHLDRHGWSAPICGLTEARRAALLAELSGR